MTYAFVNDTSTSLTATATTISVAYNTPTAGNAFIIAVAYANASSQTLSMSDSGLASGNTYTPAGTNYDSTAGVGYGLFYATNINGGASLTIQCTFGATSTFRTIYVAEYSGIKIAGPAAVNNLNKQDAPGTGAGAITTGTASFTFVPAMAWAFTYDNQTGATGPSLASAGFTRRTGNVSGGGTATWAFGGANAQMVPCDGNASGGSAVCTFTAGVGTDDFSSGILVLPLISGDEGAIWVSFSNP